MAPGARLPLLHRLCMSIQAQVRWVRAAARDLSNETRRFEAAWTELYKNYRRGRREIDQHAATIEMESGMSLDD